MDWYEFNQNNSGGVFEVTDTVCHRVWIQAGSIDAAVQKAAALGVYFNGVEDGLDCACCGDRWYEPYGATEFPVPYDKGESLATVEQYAEFLRDRYGWTDPDSMIYYADGRVVKVPGKKRA
jgi:hypothetical protein